MVHRDTGKTILQDDTERILEDFPSTFQGMYFISFIKKNYFKLISDR